MNLWFQLTFFLSLKTTNNLASVRTYEVFDVSVTRFLIRISGLSAEFIFLLRTANELYENTVSAGRKQKIGSVLE